MRSGGIHPFCFIKKHQNNGPRDGKQVGRRKGNRFDLVIHVRVKTREISTRREGDDQAINTHHLSAGAWGKRGSTETSNTLSNTSNEGEGEETKRDAHRIEDQGWGSSCKDGILQVADSYDTAQTILQNDIERERSETSCNAGMALERRWITNQRSNCDCFWV